MQLKPACFKTNGHDRNGALPEFLWKSFSTFFLITLLNHWQMRAGEIRELT